MQKIIPHLWFDTEARAAAEFYATVFPESEVTNVSVLHNTPSGDCDVVRFKVWGYELMAISAGPYFKINPAISFMVNFDPSRMRDAQEKLDDIWNKLMDGGQALMPLQEYPFSKRYGWVEDKYGVSWQLILTNPTGESRPAIIPAMMFVGGNAGKAEAATNFYMSIFKDANRGVVSRYPAGSEPDKEGSVMFTDYTLAGQWFVAMDSAHKHEFSFNEAVSLLVKCDSQAEIDEYWQKLSAVPESEQCGWLKDKFGLSWQISSSALDDYMTHGTPEQIERVTQAFLQMKKFDLAKLKAAYEGPQNT